MPGHFAFWSLMQLYSEPYRRRTELLDVELALRGADYLFTVTRLKNAPEILYRLAAVMFAHDFSIEEAEIYTLEDGVVRDRFVIRRIDALRKVEDLLFEEMMRDFEKLLFENYGVLDYLEERDHRPARPPQYSTEVTIDAGASATVGIRAPDRPGALLSMLQVFALLEVDLIQANIRTAQDGRTADTFLINPGDRRFENPRFVSHLSDAIRLLV